MNPSGQNGPWQPPPPGHPSQPGWNAGQAAPPPGFYHIPAEYYQPPPPPPATGPYYGMVPQPVEPAPTQQVPTPHVVNPQVEYPTAPQPSFYPAPGYGDPWQQAGGGYYAPAPPNYAATYTTRCAAPAQQGGWYGDPSLFYQQQPRWQQPWQYVRFPAASQPSATSEVNRATEPTPGPIGASVVAAEPTTSVEEPSAKKARHNLPPSTPEQGTVGNETQPGTAGNVPAGVDLNLGNVFTSEQYNALNKLYEEDSCPSIVARRQLAERVGLTVRQVSTWMTCRRRKGKPQTDFTPDQLKELNKVFRVNPVPTVPERQELAKKLGLPLARVSVWFAAKQNTPETPERAAVDLSNESSEPYTPSKDVPSAAVVAAAYPMPVPDEREFASFTEKQVAALCEAYKEQKYPTMESRVELSEKIGLSVTQVTGWFVARRHNERPQTIRRRKPDLTKEQLEALKDAFKANASPTLAERQELATKLGMTVSRVTGWFATQQQLPSAGDGRSD